MPELRDRLQTALGQGYRVEKELGGGGMSRVFLAEEVRLGRRVVVKVLPPEMALGVSVERFEREIQLAAKLQHPHIVPLLTAGSSDDLIYYVMPFIEGESLRAKLAREGELPVPEALRILRDVLDALAYAHRQHVVHRDIKPDNVMLSQGHALVTDFGVAKAVAESTGKQTITSMGVALGTPLYMAPEQAAASPNIDHRADIYAVGVLAYEMLCGRTPFEGPTAQAVLAAHVTLAPDPCTTHRPAVPPALNDLVMRCLEKHPADRWQKAEDLQPLLDAILTPPGGTTPAGTQPVASSGTLAALDRADPVRVTGLFVVASVGVLAIVYGAVRVIGLPDWVFWGAVLLLAVGLPIVLVTGSQERKRALAKSSGRLTAAAPSGMARHLTWRRAFLGGGFAFAGLAFVAGTFMALRAAGVGPFATLVSAGLLKERDLLVLADFVNRTTDTSLAASITEALRIDLTRSPVVRLVEGDQVVATLRRMQLPLGAQVTEAVARDVAVRDGAKAVVGGDVAPLGSGYVIAVRVMNAADDSTLLADRETAAGAADLIPAVDRLSRKLREHIGESLRTIRAGEPLEEVTTRSFAALRAYSEGLRQFHAGQLTPALQFLDQAVALDSSFGMAWRMIGVLLSDLDIDRARTLDALRRAYVLRDRMPAREAAHATAFYYGEVLQDRQQAIAAYRGLLVRWPDDVVALNNLGLYLQEEGRPDEAEPGLRRLVELQPRSLIANANLLGALVVQGKDAAADSMLGRWAGRAPQSPGRLFLTAALAAQRGRFSLALQYADSGAAGGNLDAPPVGYPVRASVRAEILRVQGRVREAALADDHGLDRMERSGVVAHRYLPALVSGPALAESLLLGRPDSAVRLVEAVLRRRPLDSLPPVSRPYGELIYFYSSAGRLDQAEALASEYQRLVPPDVREGDARGQLGLARLALARGDGRAALAGFRRARKELSVPCLVCTAFDEGRAFDQFGATDSATAAYEFFVAGPDLQFGSRDMYLGPALRRLGELYQQKGNPGKALLYYSRLVDLWKDADPELQPLVRDVKQRMAALASEGGPR